LTSKQKSIAKRKAMKKFKAGFPNKLSEVWHTIFSVAFNMGWKAHSIHVRPELESLRAFLRPYQDAWDNEDDEVWDEDDAEGI